jgi:integrase
MHVPVDDRRHLGAWSPIERNDPTFGGDYWPRYWARLDAGGAAAVATYLRDFVFSMTDGAKQLGGLTRIKALLHAAIEADGVGPLTPWSFHHLRHALATWLRDYGVDYVIADLCLAHAIPLGRSGRTYQRSYKITERRHALDMWSTLLDPEPAPVRKERKLRVVK